MIPVTKGQIVTLNTEHMQLVNNTDGTVMVTATRTDGVWTITAEGHDDRTATDRPAAIQAMADLAVECCPDTFFTTQLPPGLLEQP